MPQNFQHALQRAVLAGAAVQHVERDVGFQVTQRRGDVAGDVDAGDAIAELLGSIGAGLAGAQGNLALGRPASHQNGDVFHLASGAKP